ncbi:MAG: pantoate--beta-alanine ligase [Candidatus Omnitrophica bacterium]|nr:pantoate--beta-alanine ligase [Candidatus Omnitrophota bacterium]
MKLVNSISRMSTLVKMLKKEGKSIGFVPTMGYLHEGHMSLVRAARKHADVVVMSIFVNPLQFAPAEDYDKYPRDLNRDEELAGTAGVDIIFCPAAKDMYPEGYTTYVDVEGLSSFLCGVSRPGHFKGVTTIVSKLFNIIRPDIAYFGQKDAQQVAIIKKMVKDLNMDIEIKSMPIVRERDGLAMSSRNVYLSEGQRSEALVLNQSLAKAAALVKAGERDPEKIIKTMAEMIAKKPSVKIGYISVVDSEKLTDLRAISKEALIAVAAFVGKTRLIDNIIVKA